MSNEISPEAELYGALHYRGAALVSLGGRILSVLYDKDRSALLVAEARQHVEYLQQSILRFELENK
jgi:hypothetical protein